MLPCHGYAPCSDACCGSWAWTRRRRRTRQQPVTNQSNPKVGSAAIRGDDGRGRARSGSSAAQGDAAADGDFRSVSEPRRRRHDRFFHAGDGPDFRRFGIGLRRPERRGPGDFTDEPVRRSALLDSLRDLWRRRRAGSHASEPHRARDGRRPAARPDRPICAFDELADRHRFLFCCADARNDGHVRRQRAPTAG